MLIAGLQAPSSPIYHWALTSLKDQWERKLINKVLQISPFWWLSYGVGCDSPTGSCECGSAQPHVFTCVAWNGLVLISWAFGVFPLLQVFS